MKDFTKSTRTQDESTVRGLFQDGIYIYGWRYLSEGEIWLATRWYAADGEAVNRAKRANLVLDEVNLEVGKYYAVAGVPDFIRIKEKRIYNGQAHYIGDTGKTYLENGKCISDGHGHNLIRQVR